jgi:tetratricopeptide (TPR) repeat protein
MDSDVARLVRDGLLLDAAKLASERGDTSTSSVLYERACEWSKAAGEAMRSGDVARALELAIYDTDESTAERALALLVTNTEAAQAVAARLERRGQDAWAARVLEGCGLDPMAARAWERAGEARRAAALFERVGEPANAVRALEAALRRDPHAWTVAVALGTLLERFGKWEAAARVLQRVPPNAPERREALLQLVHALERLGLAQTGGEAAAELDALGRDTAPPSNPLQGAQPAPSPHERLFGRYDLVGEVASSPSARVLECVDVVRGGRVAVKMFAAWEAHGSGRDALARFEREVRAMKSIEHPNIVPLYEFLPEAPAIVLAWMSGGTLERMLETAGAIAPARALEIASAVLSALGAAHRLGILHRDVKPANVLFDDSGSARLGDFGVAHLGDVSATATAGLFGTLAYMSPEQREGRPATGRSDLFAVGVMLREMLTGERPRPDEPPRTLPSEAHRGLDARHDSAVARMTARDPHDRPADAFEAHALLTALPWPRTVDVPAARQPAMRSPTPGEGTDRLEPRSDATLTDLWTGRIIERLPLTERNLARARAFALADHAALQTVWRVDQAGCAIWLDALQGGSLCRPLAPHERALLEEGLEALHAAGGVHGCVDSHHAVLTSSGVVLRFEAAHDATATADRDRIALARM